MANRDLTSRVSLNLDPHLVLPLLNPFKNVKSHSNVQIRKAKDPLLSQIHSNVQILKSLHQTDDVTQVVWRLKSLEDAAVSIITFLQSPNMLNEPGKQYVLQLVRSKLRHYISMRNFNLNVGIISGAADYLHQFRTISNIPDRILNACWGKLASEILMQTWDEALDKLNRVRDVIESKVCADLYLNAIQTNAPHLLRYLATKEKTSTQRIDQSHPIPSITEFLYCLYVNYDFDGAQQKLRECEVATEEGNLSTVPLRDEFFEKARLFIFEAYCRIHQRIDIGCDIHLNINMFNTSHWCQFLPQLISNQVLKLIHILGTCSAKLFLALRSYHAVSCYLGNTVVRKLGDKNSLAV
ncbi:hypothetical protein MKW94_010851 [Papaver nudicaule]|uniref:Eukaryotic translation initiation factor 3 subunit E N-terminal domain-containing protein n=1 Tax=Papaver nudicaule TaxID=74823 RepID=A0AA41S5P7_PAPNU|nr:hypothetical protein [Papaver nudicaule]